MNVLTLLRIIAETLALQQLQAIHFAKENSRSLKNQKMPQENDSIEETEHSLQLKQFHQYVLVIDYLIKITR
jgi:hypothetical protein